MKQLLTEIMIHAPVGKVWQVLTDFERYPAWNPFITSIDGEVKAGSVFRVTMQPPDSRPMVFKPRCLNLETNKEFRWKGQLLFPWIFDGEHIFELFEEGNASTRFVQRENFSGLLVPLMWRQLNTKTRQGFESMNAKLKHEAEQNA